MKCKECIKRGKTWEGDDPVCAFTNGIFSTNNWNCATMNILREKAEKFFTYRDDLVNSSIGIIDIPEADDENIQQGYLVMTWYKNRGKTAYAYVMDDDHKPQVLTLKTAEFIIKTGKDKKGGENDGTK